MLGHTIRPVDTVLMWLKFSPPLIVKTVPCSKAVLYRVPSQRICYSLSSWSMVLGERLEVGMASAYLVLASILLRIFRCGI